MDANMWALLWAKATKNGKWHALSYHLLDVAATAEALCDRLPASSREIPCSAFGDHPSTKTILAFLAAAHDIGKANPYFQSKVPSQKRRLEQAGLKFPPLLQEPRAHGQATGAYLYTWTIQRWKWSTFAATSVARAVGGHHGEFFTDVSASWLGIGKPPWSTVGLEIIDSIAVALGVPRPSEPKALTPLLAWLAGFVSVADWLGSHERMTTWTTDEMSLTDYLKDARCRAQMLLDELQWSVPPETPPLPTSCLVQGNREPNALQIFANSVSDSFVFAIVEAPTGVGKTEAAFALAESARSKGSGIYFALPTMATANGLHGRVETYIQRATNSDVAVRLLHSQAWLYRKPFTMANDPAQEGDQQEKQAQDWFAGAKRGLLMPYGVGTVDQILIGALRAKHGFVRLFALAGKVVVIDEVHAYDVYMSGLLDVLLGWLRALGCRVIVLSATLPTSRRNALLRAWGADGANVNAAYPCVTWVGRNAEVHAQSISLSPRKPLNTRIIFTTNRPLWQQGAARILERVETQGGYGALVLNTVREAQLAYEWLQPSIKMEIDLDLFHARFTVQDRSAIEERVLKRFGKLGSRNGRAILVATQVVEQSLDLDFDHMVSALAPIDLLIQRAGRLHRHARHQNGQLRGDGESDTRPDPLLDVIAPGDGEAPPSFEDAIYAPDILSKTLLYLRSNPCMKELHDVSSAIEAVYGNFEYPIEKEWSQRLSEFEQKTNLELKKQIRVAARATIPAVVDEDTLIVDCELELDEYNEQHHSLLAARTRFENRPSVVLVLLNSNAGDAITINGADARDLRSAFMASVRCSPPLSIWKSLLDSDPLPAWQGKGSLSRCKPLRLPADIGKFEGYEVSYDRRLGLQWRKLDGNL